MTCTGFSGAEIKGFLGDPTRLFMKPVKPDFFRRTAVILSSLASSENLLDRLSALPPLDFSLSGSEAPEKLADWRRAGGAMAFVSGDVYEEGGGAGRWGAWCVVGDLVASIRLRMAVPSNGAPISSSDVLELSGRERGGASERLAF